MNIVALLLTAVYVIFGILLLALMIVGLSVLLKVNARLKRSEASSRPTISPAHGSDSASNSVISS